MLTDAKGSPLVSVVIPVYNGERYLGEAVESALSQTWPSLEVVVLDDGSTDRTAEVAGRFGTRIRYHRQPNGGLAAARNAGIALAGGEFFAHLDADDLWPADSLAARMEAFRTEPGLDLVTGEVEQFFAEELDPESRARIRCPEERLSGHIPSAVVVRRESFFRVGWYETRWKIAADMSWFMRASEQGLRMVVVPDLVLRRRIHGQNMGIAMKSHFSERLQVLKAALDRRRAAEP